MFRRMENTFSHLSISKSCKVLIHIVVNNFSFRIYLNTSKNFSLNLNDKVCNCSYFCKLVENRL